MAQFVTCVNCGANLDFGEKCDCETKKESVPPESVRPKIIYPALSIPRKRRFVKSQGRYRNGV